MAFGEGIPEDVKKKRTRLALLSFSGDMIVASVFLVFLVEELGDLAYLVAAALIAAGASFLYVFPRLPIGSSSDAAPAEGEEHK